MDKLDKSECEPYPYSYLDDIMIVSETSDEDFYWLEILLQALEGANLQINPGKSESRCAVLRIYY